jgi:hypothetical protein
MIISVDVGITLADPSRSVPADTNLELLVRQFLVRQLVVRRLVIED